MERSIVLYVLLSLQFVISVAKQELPVKIGSVFDTSEAEDVSSAFHFRLSKSPLKTTPLKIGTTKMIISINISSITHKIDMQDSYDVGSSICDLMQKGIVAIYGSNTMATNDVIRSYTDTFQIPFISSNVAFNYSSSISTSSPSPSPIPIGYQMFVRPLYAKALMDLIRHYAWKDLWYIFDSEEGLERLQQLLDCLSDHNYPVRTHIYRVHDANEAFNTLQRLDSRKEESKRILLDLPTKDCEKVLQMQNKETKGMLHHYFIVGLGISEIKLDAFNHGGMNVSGFRMVDPNNGTVKNFIMGWSNGTKGNLKKLPYEAALAADAATVIQLSIERLIGHLGSKHQSREDLMSTLVKPEAIDCDIDPIKTWKYGHGIMKSMLQVEFGGLTGQVKFDSNGLRRDYKMDVLEVSMSRGLARIGTWFSEQGLVIQPADKIRPIKGNNTIANRTRIVTSILTAPYLMEKAQPTDGTKLVGNDRYEGYCADLTKMIADFVGFDYIIKPVNDTKYGQKGENNNTWNGMVGELIRREADLAIAPLTITADREQVIDFSKPFMSLGISIMIKRPLKEQPGVFSFMNPLSYEIWMCVIFAYIGVSVVLFLVSRFSPFEWHIEDHTDGPSVTNNFTIFNSLWFSLGAFMQQGCDIEPRSVSGRIVGSVWWFFTLIIISSYTANLAAFLTVERMQSPIESAEDLAKQTEIKYGMVLAGSTMEFFKRSTIPVYERMWAFMTTTEPSVFVASNEQGVHRVRTEKYAFLIESTTNDYINQVPPCDTMKVGSNLDSKGYGVGTPLGSDLRDRITLAVLELSENEELAKLEKTWWYEKSKCPQDSSTLKKQEATSSLELPNVAGIFYILIGGLSLALIMATCEFLYKSKVEARRRKTTFSNAVKSKARLSITGMPERQATSYTYAPTAQLISLDGWSETNTHTQV